MRDLRSRLGFIILFACLTELSLAQTPIQVKSFEDQTPLAFASVVNLTKHQLYYTNEVGYVEGNFDFDDSIQISYVGYQNLKSRIAKTGHKIYFLKQSNIVLEPVHVTSCKNWVKHEYSNLISDTSKVKFGGVGWTKNAMNAKIAVLIRPELDEPRLNSFSIWLNRSIGPKEAIKAPIIFSFYSLNESTMLPGELISSKQIIYYPKKEGKQNILVDSINLRIPKPGLYVAIEYVFDEKYQYPMRFVDHKKGIDSIFMKYGGLIDGVYSKDFNLVFYNYKTNCWSFPMNRDKSTFSGVHSTIKFSTELASCKDDMKK